MKKIILIIVASILVIGFIIGINQEYNMNNFVSITMSFKSFILYIMIIILGFLLSSIGMPCYYLFLFFELLLSGFIMALFIINYKINGLCFALLFILLFKIPSYFILLLSSFYYTKYIKNMFSYLFYRYTSSKKNYRMYFKKMLVINLILIIIIIVNFSFGNYIIKPVGSYLLFS